MAELCLVVQDGVSDQHWFFKFMPVSVAFERHQVPVSSWARSCFQGRGCVHQCGSQDRFKENSWSGYDAVVRAPWPIQGPKARSGQPPQEPRVLHPRPGAENY